jgi:hypothetical protein
LTATPRAQRPRGHTNRAGQVKQTLLRHPAPPPSVRRDTGLLASWAKVIRAAKVKAQWGRSARRLGSTRCCAASSFLATSWVKTRRETS